MQSPYGSRDRRVVVPSGAQGSPKKQPTYGAGARLVGVPTRPREVLLKMSQLITMGWSMLVLFAVTMCGINGQQSSLLRATTPQPNSSCTAKEQLGQDAPRVCIQDGCILGTIMNGMKPAESFEAFLGIPYAAPPIGELRFAVSTPVVCGRSDQFNVYSHLIPIKRCVVPKR